MTQQDSASKLTVHIHKHYIVPVWQNEAENIYEESEDVPEYRLSEMSRR